jgi:hypothetical protein
VATAPPPEERRSDWLSTSLCQILNSSSLISIYLPLFVVFLSIAKQNRIQKYIILKGIKRKGKNMTNELIKKYIGKNCKISTGSFGTTVTGKIVDINENWIEVETNKGIELINSEFVQNIKVKLRFQFLNKIYNFLFTVYIT